MSASGRNKTLMKLANAEARIDFKNECRIPNYVEGLFENAPGVLALFGRVGNTRKLSQTDSSSMQAESMHPLHLKNRESERLSESHSFFASIALVRLSDCRSCHSPALQSSCD